MSKFPYFNPKAKRLEKLSKKDQADLVFDLINAFALTKDSLSSSLLLQDLLTAIEIKNLSKRLRIAKLIIKGKTQREIIENLHCSFATVARVKSWLKEAGEGLRGIIKKLPQRKKEFEFKKDALGYYGLPQILIGTYLNSLEASERKRIGGFLKNAKKKDQLYKAIQDVVNEDFREDFKGGKPRKK